MKNLIKEKNLQKLRKALRQEKTATKSRLAELTGISVVTIQSLLQILIENGEAKEDEIVQLQLGRPAVSYRFCECAELMLVIFLLEKDKKDTAVFSVVNLYGEVIEEFEKQYSLIETNCFDGKIEMILSKYPGKAKKTAVSLIAVGFPGIEHNGQILFSDYEKLRNVDFAGYLEKTYQIPVILENDINASVYGYASANGYKDEIVAGIYMPSKYPPGAGICMNGKIVKGKNGLAGEIANLPLHIDWENFDYEKEAVDCYLIQTIRIISCLYNPTAIVLYDERKGREEIPDKVAEQMKTKAERLMLPCIVTKESMKDDFRNGMIRLALSKVLQEE
ncbi:MAG: ROK family protein [Lachnospiraceae bacterium]|nr:ROK family protein [Lachnospiraceae bacterium]